MTESLDRAAIKARAEEASKESRYSPDSYVHLPPAEVLALLAALEEAEREVERLKAKQPPCDGGCNYNTGPEETCSAHGRPVAEVWNIVEDVARQRNEAERRIAAVEALAKERSADELEDDPIWPWEIAAALHPVVETTEKGGNYQ